MSVLTSDSFSDSLSGRAAGNIWLLSHEATIEFHTDLFNNLQGFNASYTAENISRLSGGCRFSGTCKLPMKEVLTNLFWSLADEEKINCSFEEGFCLWRQELKHDHGDWMRALGSIPPAGTGPSFDHTLANPSGAIQ